MIEALPHARERVPEPAHARRGRAADRSGDACPQVDGLEVRGYVHELYRHLAACDVAVVQGGLTTTMELVAAQAAVRLHPAAPATSSSASTCATGSTATAPGAWLEYEAATPDALAEAIATGISERPVYRRVDPRGARRAARLIAELLVEP